MNAYSDSEEEKNVTRYKLEVPPGQQTEIRLDKYITSFIENATRNKVQQAIKAGYVEVNGKKEKPSYLMQSGDVIEIALPKPPRPDPSPEKIPLDITYEDEDLLIVNKPAHMVVHPAHGNWTGTLVNALLYHVDQLSAENQDTLRPGIVHRLDKDTSGLLVVAKKDHIHAKLSKYFQEREIERNYWAIVWGHPYKEGVFDSYLGRNPKDRKKMAVVGKRYGKRAITHYKVLEYFDHLSLVDIQLKTGRTHQIRVHFGENHFPVFGDPVYGGNSVRYGPNTGSRRKMFENLFKSLRRQALHAKTLAFEHPESGDYQQFVSELPKDVQDVLDMLRKQCKLPEMG